MIQAGAPGPGQARGLHSHQVCSQRRGSRHWGQEAAGIKIDSKKFNFKSRLETFTLSHSISIAVRCQLIHFFENINFYILIPPSKYDNKEILRLQGSVEGPKILRFRFL